jgi:hypothetical protein
MNPAHRYVFRSEWRLRAHRDEVYEALRDVESYPRWWPQIRAGRRIDDTSGEITCRSLLPYDLVFEIHREVEDPTEGILRGRLHGDLAGTSQWTIRTNGGGSVAVFDEDVVVGKSSVRSAGRFVRPALRFNHDLMMRSGERGLRGYLSGA